MSKKVLKGWATKYGIKCTDGLTINKDAFKHQDGVKVPLLWQHDKSEPGNVLGHVTLEHRDDGVYCIGEFNDTPNAEITKDLVDKRDINAFSIHATNLRKSGMMVSHGDIREVSLVVAGANPGAIIEEVLTHSDGSMDAHIIMTSELSELSHEEVSEDKTVGDVLETLTEDQLAAVGYLLSQEEIKHSEEEKMKKNLFNEDQKKEQNTLSHADYSMILAEAQRAGATSLKAFISGSSKINELSHGVEDLGLLLPDYKQVAAQPGLIQEDNAWVSIVWNGVQKRPFARIKTLDGDITMEAARARGYIKGNMKEEQAFKILKRTTDPQMVYVKQKFDREDILDITDLNLTAWTKSVMRIKMDEEIARAILLGDGRAVDSPDKIEQDHIRSIYNDDALYTMRRTMTFPADATNYQRMSIIEEALLRGMNDYKGSGNVVFFVAPQTLTTLLLAKDNEGRRIYKSMSELEAALMVNKIIKVPQMAELSRVDGSTTLNLAGIVVDLKDYVVGADKGGSLQLFDDFDIDYNQYKYLLETRISGAPHKPYSALVLETTSVVNPIRSGKSDNPVAEITTDEGNENNETE